MRRIVISILSVALALGATPAAAEPSEPDSPLAGECAAAHQAGPSTEVELSAPESQRLRVKAIQALRSGALSEEVRPSDLLIHQSRSFHMDDFDVVTIPLRDLDAGSALTVAFSSDGDLASWTEARFTEIDEMSGHARIVVDGHVVIDDTVDISAVVTPSHHGMGFWSALNSCLSSAGVSAWIVAAAGFACGAGGPVGMAICLAGAGIGAGTASYCVRWAITHG